MTRSENPFHVSFWLGDVDPRPLALFRVGLGLTLLHDLANYTRDLRVFITDEGMMPRGAQGDPLAVSVFDAVGSVGAVSALFAAGVLVVAAFTAGAFTRVTAVLTWVFVSSLHTRNLTVTDGGDDLVRNLLFLTMFTDAGAAYSVDARRRRERRPLFAAPFRFLQAHMALLYFVAARLKFRSGWLTRNVIYTSLQLTGFLRPPGELLLSFPGLVYLLGVVTLALEWCFAFFAFSPFRIAACRALAIFCGVAVQMGILVTMRVGVFTETMLVAMLLFVQPEWLDRLEAFAAKRRGTSPEPALALVVAKSVPEVRAPRVAAVVLFAFHLVSLAWWPFIGGRIRPPDWVMAERRLLWLDQPFGLFDIVYDVPRWDVHGKLASGETVDVVPVTLPELVPHVAWSFSRWYKFTFKERERPIRYRELAHYMCHEYEKHAGRPLTELVIVTTLTPPVFPGVSPGGPTRATEKWRGACPSVDHPGS